MKDAPNIATNSNNDNDSANGGQDESYRDTEIDGDTSVNPLQYDKNEVNGSTSELQSNEKTEVSSH